MSSDPQQPYTPPAPQPPIGRVIRRMVWTATTDLVRQLLALGVELISGRRRAARSALASMSARQLRDLGLSSPPARIRHQHFSQAEAQLGTLR
jgi:hypothetical protein